jgi:hypothetical protein
MKLIAFGVIDAVIGAVLELAGAIGGVIDSIAGMFGASTGIQSAARDFKGYTHREMAKDFGVESLSFTPVKPTTAQPAPGAPPPATTPMPAAVPLQMSVQPNALSLPVTQNVPPPQPVVVNVQIDGQTVARAVHKAGSDTASRSFSPVPAY